MNASATLTRATMRRVLQIGDHDLVLCFGTTFVTGLAAVAALSAAFIATENVNKQEYPS
jgi:hypothetical protein